MNLLSLRLLLRRKLKRMRTKICLHSDKRLAQSSLNSQQNYPGFLVWQLCFKILSNEQRKRISCGIHEKKRTQKCALLNTFGARFENYLTFIKVTQKQYLSTFCLCFHKAIGIRSLPAKFAEHFKMAFEVGIVSVRNFNENNTINIQSKLYMRLILVAYKTS